MPWKWGAGDLIEIEDRATPWKYDSAEKRSKHKWLKNEAGFLPPEGRNRRGQCPTSIHPTLAEELLNDGIPWPPEADVPERLYNVHESVIYRAVETEFGKSYHGFPECEKVPDTVLEELARRADHSGYYRQFKKWLRLYIPDGRHRLKYQPRHSD